jgi:hypothetical protein
MHQLEEATNRPDSRQIITVHTFSFYFLKIHLNKEEIEEDHDVDGATNLEEL